MSQCGVGKIENPFGGRPQDPQCIDDVAWQINHANKTEVKKSAKKPKRTKSRKLRLAGRRHQKDSYQKCQGGKDQLVFRNPFNGQCSSITLGSRRLTEAWKGLKKSLDSHSSSKKSSDFQKRENAIKAKVYVDQPGPEVREYQKHRFIRVDVSGRGNR